MKHFTIISGSKTLHLGERTRVMGVINCTPDSFSDGGMYRSPQEAVDHALSMVEDGADIIDIGGESTRPGSDAVTEEEELARVLPVIEGLRERSSVWISTDTCKATVAMRALQSGADMINDISGLRFDRRMPDIAVEYDVPVVVMHIQGEPKNMQENPVYDDVIRDIYAYFTHRISFLTGKGIKKDKILIDPGIGFGKTVKHNLILLNNLDEFSPLEKPILVGPSRKSFIGKILDTDVHDRLEGTAAAVAISIARGAHIVRVHDVKEMQRVSRLTDAIVKSGKPELISN